MTTTKTKPAGKTTTAEQGALNTLPDRWRGRLKHLVSIARQAPSSHNSQPWLVRIDDNVLELRPDRRRATSVVDPDDRELTMSCGAFLFHLRMAARHDGLSSHITTFPNVVDAASRELGLDRADVFARVVFSDDAEFDGHQEGLFTAISARRTWRLPFARESADDVDVARLCSAAAVEGCSFVPVIGELNRNALARLASQADRIQWAEPAFRAELATWCHAGRSGDGDGLPSDALASAVPFVPFAPLVVRTFDRGGACGAHDAELVAASPLLGVLFTDGDHEADWLRSGQALDRLLLTATVHGLAASFLNQIVEVPGTRRRLQQLLSTSRVPQAVLRVGRPDRASPQPALRRPVDELLLP